MNEFSYTKHILYIGTQAHYGGGSNDYVAKAQARNKTSREKSTANIAEYFGLKAEDKQSYHSFMYTHLASSSEKSEGAVSANGFIRWDALCHLFNKHFIPINEKDGLPLFVLTCTQLINEDLPINESEVRAGKHMSPILMAKVNNPLADKIISGETTALDNSLDPTVCLAPHQHERALNNERSKNLVELHNILEPIQ